jgi:PAS domain S-box-containing protein
MDRYRGAIEAEVHRRLGRNELSPYARIEIVRRFRSFCRLASIDIAAARPSLDGLGGTPAAGLELAVSKAVEAACECGPTEEVANTLRELEARFRAGIRRLTQPIPEERQERRSRRRKTPNAGRRVRAAIDRIGDAYLALCLDTGRLFDVNPAAETLFGVDATQLLERELAELISPLDRDDFRQLEARLDAGEASGPLEMVFARPAGDEVPVQVTVVNHTIGTRRLAIFIARETLPGRDQSFHPDQTIRRNSAN